jgi:hypothetical protein
MSLDLRLLSVSMRPVMCRKVQDEFTHLPISRQLKYQLRTRRDQRCMEWTSFCLATETIGPCLIVSLPAANKSSGRVFRPGLFLLGREPRTTQWLVRKGGPLGRGRWGRPSGPGLPASTKRWAGERCQKLVELGMGSALLSVMRLPRAVPLPSSKSVERPLSSPQAPTAL